MAWFEANERFKNACYIRYIDFPKYFTCSKADRQWRTRTKCKLKSSTSVEYDFTRPPHSVVGRIYNMSPREVERYFLRTLLLHIPGITFFKEIMQTEGRNTNLIARPVQWVDWLTIRSGCDDYRMHFRLRLNR